MQRLGHVELRQRSTALHRRRLLAQVQRARLQCSGQSADRRQGRNAVRLAELRRKGKLACQQESLKSMSFNTKRLQSAASS